jgi:hypothetical protein
MALRQSDEISHDGVPVAIDDVIDDQSLLARRDG